MATKTYQQLIEETRDPAAKTAKSIEWLLQQTGRTVASLSPSTVMEMGRERFTRNIEIGQMYMFVYDPKMKKELPYYDRFPLIFPFQKADNGFYGINMHYLPYQMRARLMDQLYTVANNTNNNESTKLMLSYKILSSASQFKYFRPCVKQYLNNHVKSRFLLVPANMWDRVLFLPLERFAKASKTKVFQDSSDMLR